MLDAIQKMSAFVELSTVNNQGPRRQHQRIGEFDSGSVGDAGHGRGAKTQKPAQTASPTTAKSGGLIGQLVTLYDQVQSFPRDRSVARRQCSRHTGGQ